MRGASKPSVEHSFFAENVLEIIGPTVERFDFVKDKRKIEECFTSIVFRKNTQYVKISGSTYPTDYPYTYNVIFGEGDSEDVFEFDWNSVALWRLKNKIEHSTGSKEYNFPYGDKVKLSLLNAKDDLIKYGDSFLRGDLTLFYETRSEQNKAREPYKISTPDKNGNYTTTYEKISAEKKNKYS